VLTVAERDVEIAESTFCSIAGVLGGQGAAHRSVGGGSGEPGAQPVVDGRVVEQALAR
jgi:hypothetical protein